MSGIKGKSGGARASAGRKPKVEEEEVINLLDSAWPAEKRKAAIKAMAELAQGGDVKAFSVLMAYRYGRPADGDQQKINEQVEAELDAFAHRIRETLEPAAAEAVIEALGLA